MKNSFSENSNLVMFNGSMKIKVDKCIVARIRNENKAVRV